MSGKKIINAFDMAPPRSKEVKPSKIHLKPGQRLDIAGRIISEKAVKQYSVFRVEPSATLEQRMAKVLINAQRESAYRYARSTGKK